jgi:hypothetical protein
VCLLNKEESLERATTSCLRDAPMSHVAAFATLILQETHSNLLQFEKQSSENPTS